MTRDDLLHWAGLLRSVSQNTLGPLAAGQGASTSAMPAGEFRDERGHRRDVDRPFFAWRRGTPAGECPRGVSGDVRLWYALHDETIEPTEYMPVDEDSGPSPIIATRSDSIEVYTETQLCALHALLWLAARRKRADLRAAAVNGAEYLIRELQPDNGTNHPWAVHVFVLLHEDLAARGLGDETLMYAQTLLHNSQVSMGRADVFSAHILADAAHAIDVWNS